MRVKQWLNEEKSNLKKVTVIARDDNDTLESLLNHIKNVGNGGHSFHIVVDPDSSEKENFDGDGDGVDMIKTVKVENIKE